MNSVDKKMFTAENIPGAAGTDVVEVIIGGGTGDVILWMAVGLIMPGKSPGDGVACSSISSPISWTCASSLWGMHPKPSWYMMNSLGVCSRSYSSFLLSVPESGHQVNST